jgi:glutamine cyclotransferase
MKKLARGAVYVAASALVVIIVLFSYWSFASDNDSPTVYSYSVVATYPHDTEAFTEGLMFFNGSLYESTGGWGTSGLRQVNLANGNIAREVLLPEQYFGEGLTIVLLTYSVTGRAALVCHDEKTPRTRTLPI